MAGEEKQSKLHVWLTAGGIVGVAGVLISAAGLFFGTGIFHHADTAVPDYQKQVHATCSGVHAIVTADHGVELFRPNPNHNVTDPQDLFVVDKAAVLRVARSNVAAVTDEFAEMNKLPTPAQLQAQKHAVELAEQEWLVALQQEIRRFETDVRDGMTLRQFNEVLDDSQLRQKSARLNSALSVLAGGECQATG